MPCGCTNKITNKVYQPKSFKAKTCYYTKAQLEQMLIDNESCSDLGFISTLKSAIQFYDICLNQEYIKSFNPCV